MLTLPADMKKFGDRVLKKLLKDYIGPSILQIISSGLHWGIFSNDLETLRRGWLDAREQIKKQNRTIRSLRGWITRLKNDRTS
jgi:hypothetical protein